MTTQPSLVSTVVPTYNSSETIGVCVRSILDQTYSSIEILVVDNFSTDDTREVVRKLGVRLFTAGPERSSQVNFGVRSAMGKYVYRVDSDFLLDPNIITECVALCDGGGFDGVVVRNESDPTVSFWSRVRKFERDMHQDNRSNIAVRFVRRAVWLELGGLDENLVAGEDYDFHERFVKSGHRFGFTSSRELHLKEPRSLSEVAIKHFYYGKSIIRYVKKDVFSAASNLDPLRTMRMRNKTFRDPKLLGGYALYQLVRYIATLLGVISTI